MLSGSSVRGFLSLRDALPSARAHLAGLCYAPPSVGTDGRVDARLRLWFQRFLSIKLLCMFHLVWAWRAPGGGWLHGAAAAATLGMNSPRTARYGTLIWLGLVLALVVRSWPYTLNHILLEGILLGLLVLFPVRFDAAGARESSDDLQLLWLTLLSVWFFAGVQKAVHGYYLNGESMALSLLTDPEGSGRGLRLGLSALSSALGVPAAAASPDLPVLLGVQQVSLGGLGRVYCIALGGFVVAAELALPTLTFFRATLCLGEFEIQVAAVPAGRAPGLRRSIGFDATTLGYFGLSSLSVAGVMAVLSLLAPPAGLTPDEQTVSERLYLLQSYLTASAERERESAVARGNRGAAAASARASAALRHSLPPPRVEVPPTGAEQEDAPFLDTALGNEDPAPDLRERRAQIEKARSFGVLALMRANFAALADPQLRFRRTLSGAELATMHQLFNPDSDPLFGVDGPGGLALSGIGLGGGGRADVIPLDAVGTIGNGEGTGLERAAQFGSPAGSYRPGAPELRAHTGATSDALAPAVVRRTVHAEFSRILKITKAQNREVTCPEDLGGRVVV